MKNCSYNKKTNTLVIYADFNDELKNLPEQTLIIIFNEQLDDIRSCSKFNKPVDNLPNSVTDLTFGFAFNQLVDNLPNSLTHLTFGWNFNQLVDNLPGSHKCNKISNCTCQSQNLTHLNFGIDFNQKIDNLPNSLTHLTFKHCFNQIVDNLPNSITHLQFGTNFNQSVDNLPNDLRFLSFGYGYKKKVEKLQKSIKELCFWSNNCIKNIISDTIENIYICFFNNDINNEMIENIPPTVKQIKLNKKDKIHFITKIPFGCKIIDKYDVDIIL